MNKENVFGFVFLEINWSLNGQDTQVLLIIKKGTEKKMFLEQLVGNARD